MASVAAQPAESGPAVKSTADADERYVGAVTRSVAWIVDVVLINVVAILTGLGVALVTSVVHTSGHHRAALGVISGVVYVLWIAVYFVAFWITTGQTPGARFMQIRLVTAKGARVKPVRGVVRLIGMELAAIPLWGRRPLPDWLARTRVVEASQISIAMAAQEARRTARERGGADRLQPRDGD